MFKNTERQYGLISICLHWLIFIFVVGMILSGYFVDDLHDKVLRKSLFNLHKLTGISILFLMLLRFGWIMSHPKPISLNVIRWQRVIEHVVHYILYLLLILMPLVGWLGSSSAGKVPAIGRWSLQLPIPHDKSFIDFCFYLHNKIAIAIIVMVSLHAAVALYHHFILKDQVLKRMLPSLFKICKPIVNKP